MLKHIEVKPIHKLYIICLIVIFSLSKSNDKIPPDNKNAVLKHKKFLIGNINVIHPNNNPITTQIHLIGCIVLKINSSIFAISTIINVIRNGMLPISI